MASQKSIALTITEEEEEEEAVVAAEEEEEEETGVVDMLILIEGEVNNWGGSL